MTSSLEEQLALANCQEDPALGKSLVLPVLEAAERAGDLSMQARALACLAQCEDGLCQRRSAHSVSTRAAQLFQTLGNLEGEAAALTTLSMVSSVLGRNEAAVEAALLALELSKRADNPQSVSVAYAKLGHSLALGRTFDEAMEALGQAEALAVECSSVPDELGALVLQGMCQVLRGVTLRHEGSGGPSVEQAHELLERIERFVSGHDMVALAQPDQMLVQVFLELVSSVLHCWCGKVQTANMKLESARSWLARTGVAPSMETFEALVRCELAQVELNFTLAAQQARRMIALADEVEHEQAALLGHMLACRVFELQGRTTDALIELKAMTARERRIRSESLSTRHEIVAMQLDMRRSEQSRLALQASSLRLEKLSMEDPLTGIANRRCFEAVAREGLLQRHSLERGLCVALLDVDGFKQVNDEHSHLVGDKVLQVIASLLTEHVRSEDLAARLAGDEFTILFRRTDARTASDACERLRSAIASHDWGQISPGLSVSISIGVAEAQQGDSLEALLERSDAAMYERKRSAVR